MAGIDVHGVASREQVGFMGGAVCGSLLQIGVDSPSPVGEEQQQPQERAPNPVSTTSMLHAPCPSDPGSAGNLTASCDPHAVDDCDFGCTNGHREGGQLQGRSCGHFGHCAAPAHKASAGPEADRAPGPHEACAAAEADSASPGQRARAAADRMQANQGHMHAACHGEAHPAFPFMPLPYGGGFGSSLGSMSACESGCSMMQWERIYPGPDEGPGWAS
eukprot:388049-Pelagomonas_calceolata.AAC.4